MTPEQVLRIPAYLGMMMMGAISPDHEHLSMTAKDAERYPMRQTWKKQRESLKRNLNQVM